MQSREKRFKNNYPFQSVKVAEKPDERGLFHVEANRMEIRGRVVGVKKRKIIRLHIHGEDLDLVRGVANEVHAQKKLDGINLFDEDGDKIFRFRKTRACFLKDRVKDLEDFPAKSLGKRVVVTLRPETIYTGEGGTTLNWISDEIAFIEEIRVDPPRFGGGGRGGGGRGRGGPPRGGRDRGPPRGPPRGREAYRDRGPPRGQADFPPLNYNNRR